MNYGGIVRQKSPIFLSTGYRTCTCPASLNNSKRETIASNFVWIRHGFVSTVRVATVKGWNKDSQYIDRIFFNSLSIDNNLLGVTIKKHYWFVKHLSTLSALRFYFFWLQYEQMIPNCKKNPIFYRVKSAKWDNEGSGSEESARHALTSLFALSQRRQRGWQGSECPSQCNKANRYFRYTRSSYTMTILWIWMLVTRYTLGGKKTSFCCVS